MKSSSVRISCSHQFSAWWPSKENHLAMPRLPPRYLHSFAPHDLLGVFQVYDIDHDGAIGHDEMLQIVRSVYKLAGPSVQLPKDEDTPEKVRFDQAYFHSRDVY